MREQKWVWQVKSFAAIQLFKPYHFYFPSAAPESSLSTDNGKTQTRVLAAQGIDFRASQQGHNTQNSHSGFGLLHFFDREL